MQMYTWASGCAYPYAWGHCVHALMHVLLCSILLCVTVCNDGISSLPDEVITSFLSHDTGALWCGAALDTYPTHMRECMWLRGNQFSNFFQQCGSLVVIKHAESESWRLNAHVKKNVFQFQNRIFILAVCIDLSLWHTLDMCLHACVIYLHTRGSSNFCLCLFACM